VEKQTESTRFLLLLIGVFGVSAAALAAVGLYGVVAYGVGLRRKEFGIRLALGAREKSVEVLVLRRGLLLAISGVGAGLVGAVLLAGTLNTMLFGVGPRDPIALGLTACGLVGISALASWLPARKAGRTSPLETLRSE